jgi:ActR/RegA family two-component response regulator
MIPDAKVEHPAAGNQLPVIPKVLIVDDDDLVLETLRLTLTRGGFQVVAAANVKDALKHVSSESFDVLVSDLHMPAPGDGLTVVSAMRHFHPQAVTILLSAFPEMSEAAKAILEQTDEVLVKPMNYNALIGTITTRLQSGKTPPRVIESVAAILERETQSTIEEWLGCVDVDPLVTIVPLDDNIRCAHLPQLFHDLVFRLRNPLPLGRRALISPAAAEHGMLRRKQGYSAAMMVEESRMLQVSIFQTLQNNLHKVDFSLLLVGVMAIADEVDSQLAQAMAGYISESKLDGLLVTA